MDSMEGINADIPIVDIYSGGIVPTCNGGIDPIDLIARIENLRISNGSGHTTSPATSSKAAKRPCLSNLPAKEDVYAHYNITQERHKANMCLLLQDFALKARHIARLTRNRAGGEIWPLVVEPAALQLSEIMNTHKIDWRNVPYREDYLEELDFYWRNTPETLLVGINGHKVIWEYVTGLARTWDHGRKYRSIRLENDAEDHYRKKCPSKNFHIVKSLRVPPIPTVIRRNQFIGVGDEGTACICPRPQARCHIRCVHTDHIEKFKYQRKKARMAANCSSRASQPTKPSRTSSSMNSITSLAGNPRKRAAAEMDADSMIGTPGDIPAAKKSKQG